MTTLRCDRVVGGIGHRHQCPNRGRWLPELSVRPLTGAHDERIRMGLAHCDECRERANLQDFALKPPDWAQVVNRFRALRLSDPDWRRTTLHWRKVDEHDPDTFRLVHGIHERQNPH